MKTKTILKMKRIDKILKNFYFDFAISKRNKDVIEKYALEIIWMVSSIDKYGDEFMSLKDFKDMSKLIFDEGKESFNLILNSNNRFKIKVGKFGCFLYDSKEKKDIDLIETLNFLNSAYN